MTFSVCLIAEQVEARFSDCYRHFKEFQESPDYRPYWDKCMEAVRNRELLSHIIFCNDLLVSRRSKPFCYTTRKTLFA